MSVSVLVFIIFGQYWGPWLKNRFGLNLFATGGYEPGLGPVGVLPVSPRSSTSYRPWLRHPVLPRRDGRGDHP